MWTHRIETGRVKGSKRKKRLITVGSWEISAWFHYLSGPIARRAICLYYYGAWDVYDLNVCTNINILKSLLFPLKCKTIHFGSFFFFFFIAVSFREMGSQLLPAVGVSVGLFSQMLHNAKFSMTGRINEELAYKEAKQTSHVTLTANQSWMKDFYLSLWRAVTRSYVHIYLHLMTLKRYYAFKKRKKKRIIVYTLLSTRHIQIYKYFIYLQFFLFGIFYLICCHLCCRLYRERRGSAGTSLVLWMFWQPPASRGAKEPTVVSLLKDATWRGGFPPWLVTDKYTVVTLYMARSDEHQGRFGVCIHQEEVRLMGFFISNHCRSRPFGCKKYLLISKHSFCELSVVRTMKCYQEIWHVASLNSQDLCLTVRVRWDFPKNNWFSQVVRCLEHKQKENFQGRTTGN